MALPLSLKDRQPMNKTFLAICIAVLYFSCRQKKEVISVSNGLVIENVTLITPNSNGIITRKKQYLILEGTKIIAITAIQPQIKGTFKTIDGRGKYVIPGLIDSHVHLNNIAGLSHWQRQSESALAEAYFERLPKNFLYYGYTTLIDVDNYAPERIHQLNNVPIGPEIYSCGEKLQVMNDFEMCINERSISERLKYPFLYDKYNPNVKYPDTLDLNKHSSEFLVKKIASQGHICVKALYEDASSGLPQIWEKPSIEIIKSLVSESHDNGMSMVIHAPSFKGQQLAYENGVDVIAHAMWNWADDPQRFLDTILPETHKVLLQKIAKKGMGYQPTFRAILGEADILEGKFIENHKLDELYSDDYMNYLKSEGAEIARFKILGRAKFLAKTNPEFFYTVRNNFNTDTQMFNALYKSYKSKMNTVVGLIAKNNGNLLFGTDNGAMHMYTHPPGLNGYLEMGHWIEAGVSLRQLLSAATYNNAKTFNLLDSVGTVEVGKTANLLILNSDPLESVKAYNDIQIIINKGQIIHRKTLKAN